MPDVARFVVFMTALLLIFVELLKFTIRKRKTKPSLPTTVAIAFVVVVLGMLFVPALTTILLPPFSLRMSRHEILQYLPLAWLTAPVIQVLFSLLLGWHDYMPFPVYIPSIVELARHSAV